MPSSRTRRVAASALLLLAGAQAASAESCRAPATQAEMNRCEGEAFGAADAALNAVYGEIVKAPDFADRLDKLRAAERAWVAFRTAQCAFESAAAEGGSMQPMLDSACATNLTKSRTADLKATLACRGGAGQC